MFFIKNRKKCWVICSGGTTTLKKSSISEFATLISMQFLPSNFPMSNSTGSICRRPAHGIDLSKACKAINDCIFGQIDNLHFHAGDVFDLLNVDGFRGDVLHHSRILLLLPQSFVEGLFKAARDAGFMYLVGFEQFGLSSETLEPYEFSDEDKESVYWRDRMLIHNYPGIAIKLGAEIIDAHILKTANRSPDYRVFCYIAKF